MPMEYSRELEVALKDFGFDEKQTKIYLAALELGSTTVLELSRRTRLPRTTLYPILEDLRRQGFFKYGKKARKTVYTAEAPSILAKQMQAREKHFLEIVPKLEALRGTVHEGAGVTLYEGGDGFRQLWRKIYRSGVKDYRMITTGAGMLEFVQEPYLIKHIIAERLRRGIKSFQLISDSPLAQSIVLRDPKELRESRFLPKGVELPATIIIFGAEVAFITTRKENTMILVASGEAAITHRTVFDLLWNCAASKQC